jgi:hypothetical protein
MVVNRWGIALAMMTMTMTMTMTAALWLDVHPRRVLMARVGRPLFGQKIQMTTLVAIMVICAARQMIGKYFMMRPSVWGIDLCPAAEIPLKHGS